MFSSRSFIVSGLTFRPLIHFYLIFVYGVKEWSNFTFLSVAVYFSQQHLLKRFFPTLYSLASLIDHRFMGLFLGFYPVPLICISIFVPVPYCPTLKWSTILKSCHFDPPLPMTTSVFIASNQSRVNLETMPSLQSKNICKWLKFLYMEWVI